MDVEETVYFVEMRSPDELAAAKSSGRVELRRVEIPLPELNFWFYVNVGKNWNWTDRLLWPTEKWRANVSNPAVETWVGYVQGTPIGYAELRVEHGDVEISSFGLLPPFIGQGLGGELLTRVIETAWRRRPGRVWLHTCTFDHPRALANYQARGFKLYDQKKQMKHFPDEPPPAPF